MPGKESCHTCRVAVACLRRNLSKQEKPKDCISYESYPQDEGSTLGKICAVLYKEGCFITHREIQRIHNLTEMQGGNRACSGQIKDILKQVVERTK